MPPATSRARRGVRTAASSAWTEGRRASAVRVAAKIVRCTGPSAIAAHDDAGMRGGRDEVGQERDGQALRDERRG